MTLSVFFQSCHPSRGAGSMSCLGCCGITPGVGLGIGGGGGAVGAMVSLMAAGSRLLMSTVLLCFEHVLLFYLYIYL